MRQITIVVPEAPASAPQHVAGRRKIAKDELRLGILDNGKANADHLLAMVVESLRSQLPIAAVVATRKPAFSRPAPPAIIDQLAADADLVVSAMAD